MLLAAGYDVPQQLFVHGYLLLDDRKISKSLGNVVDPLDLVDVYGADAVRFWCARSVSFGQDGAPRSRACASATSASSATTSATSSRASPRWSPAIGTGRSAACRRRTRRSPRSSSRSPTTSPTRLDGFDLTGALERDLGGRAGRSTGTSRRRAPWQLAKDEARADELDRVLYDLVDGLRAVASPSPPTFPRPSSAHPRGARPAARPRLGRRRVRTHGGGRRASSLRHRSSRASTSPRPRRDRHARAPRRVRRGRRRELLERARAAGVTRVDHRRHRDRLVPARRSRSRRRNAGVVRGARDRPPPGGDRRRRPRRRAARAARAPARRRRRRDGPRRPPRPRDRCGAAGALRRAARARRRARPAGRHPQPRGERGDGRGAGRRSPARSSCTASRSPTCWRRRSSAGTTSPSRGTSRTRAPRTLRARGRRGARRPASSRRPTARTSRPQPVRGRPNEPAHVRHTLATLALARRGVARRARGADRRERDRARSASTAHEPVAPKKSLGQHFLVDRNVLGVIERLAHPAAGRRRARDRPGPRRAHDASSRTGCATSTPSSSTGRSSAPLREALGDRTNVDLHLVDALALDLTALEPPPGSSSRTSRTTSRRRSSPRRSSARRRSTRGA